MAEEIYNASPKVQQADEHESIDFKELIHLCVSNWYWFVISLILALGLAALYILTTPKQYMRQCSVLIKDQKNSSSLSSDFGKFSDVGFNIDNTNLHNEIITFKSPSYMMEVVKTLHLDMVYVMDGTFHPVVLYGKTLPVNVVMPDVDPEEHASFTMKLLDNNEVLCTNFSGGALNHLDEDDTKARSEAAKKALRLKLNVMSLTPVGKVLITPSDYYVGKVDASIQVHHAPITDKAEAYASGLIAELNDDRASVIDLKIINMSPELADDILYTLYDVYNKKWVEDINKQATSTSNFIDEELRQIQNELGNVDESIAGFKSANQVPDINLAANIAMHKAESNSAQLLDLNNQLLMANHVRSQLASGDKHRILPTNTGIEGAAIPQQINMYNEKVMQRNSLVANSNENNPLVQELDESLNSMRQAIIASVDNVIVTLKGRIGDLRASSSVTQGQISSNPTQAKYILTVERQQKVKEQLYLFLLQKREETQLSKAFTAYNTKLLNPPRGSKRPAKPVKFNVLLVALLLGLIMPLLIIFLINTLDTKVHTRKDLESLTLPFIGEIPLSYRKRKGLLGLFNKRKEVREIVVKERSGNAINEAFRVVRTNLEFVSGKENRCKVIMLTSAYAGSGKTFISANLATSFAIKGKRVLLIDMDLRKGSLSAFVNSPDLGISDFLSEHIDNLDEIMVKGSINENLDVIGVGTTPPNPTELLYNNRLEMMLSQMRERYDYVFIDCPPLEIVADASIINKLCDMTIFVVRSGLFEKSNLVDLERNYTEKRYKNLTLILNGTYDEYNGYGYHRYGYADNYYRSLY